MTINQSRLLVVTENGEYGLEVQLTCLDCGNAIITVMSGFQLDLYDLVVRWNEHVCHSSITPA